MGIFGRTTTKNSGQEGLASLALNAIADGVMILDASGKVQFMNPAALTLSGYTSAAEAVGLPYTSVLRFENGQGQPMADTQNPLVHAVSRGEAFSSRVMVLVSLQGKKTPVAIVLTVAGQSNKILTFRNIEKELKEESEQTEFISTASHEMRTPVASIEGYLGLALNPNCATIDERAQKYLTEAHNASQHLGRLFRDLLDVTKLDDKRMRTQMRPVDMNEMVQKIASVHQEPLGAKQVRLAFGEPNARPSDRRLAQALYASVDVDFLKEILDNLLENAGKYTPAGGSVWVNVKGETDRVVINVTDTGIGIAPADIEHIFQKFYRVDNSQTRTIGGTGLGLYIVKVRAEAMGGKVWAESNFGHGSTFYVSLPRLSSKDYARQKQIFENTERMRMMKAPAGLGTMTNTAVFAATPEVLVPKVQSAPVAAVAQPAPVAQPVPAAQPAPVAQAAPQVAQTTPVAQAAPAMQSVPVPTTQPAPAPVKTISQMATPITPAADNTPRVKAGLTNDPTRTVQDLGAERLAKLKAKFAQQVAEVKGGGAAGGASN